MPFQYTKCIHLYDTGQSYKIMLYILLRFINDSIIMTLV